MKKFFSIQILFSLLVFDAFAQQDAMYTQYMFNTISVNPAYAGSRDALSVTTLNRSQWVGLDGAPTTQTLNLDSPVRFKNVGIGLSLTNDKIGITNMLSVYTDYSYKISINQNSSLSFGLKVGLDKLSDKYSDLFTENQSDLAFSTNYTSGIMPNFGFGLYLVSSKFYVGASVPRILKYNYGNNLIESDLKEGRQHYFLIAGMVFELPNNLVLKPTTIVKTTNGAPIESDVTATVIFKNKFWIGAMYRTGDAGGLLTGINITNQFSIGYAYDFSFLQYTQTLSSHEIVVRYDFLFKNDPKILSPRYF